MDGVQIPPQQGETTPTRRKVSPQQLRDALGADTCTLIANALRFLGMNAQIRSDPGARKFYDDMARFFAGK